MTTEKKVFSYLKIDKQVNMLKLKSTCEETILLINLFPLLTLENKLLFFEETSHTHTKQRYLEKKIKTARKIFIQMKVKFSCLTIHEEIRKKHLPNKIIIFLKH